MIEFFAFLGCFILTCLAVFQIALACGAPIARFAWGGAHTVLPKRLRIASLSSILLYVFFAGILLEKAGLTELVANNKLVSISMWVITLYFFVGILMNAMSRSKSERNTMTPIAALLAVSFLVVALG